MNACLSARVRFACLCLGQNSVLPQTKPQFVSLGVLWEYEHENLAIVLFGGEVKSKFYGQNLVGHFLKCFYSVPLLTCLFST